MRSDVDWHCDALASVLHTRTRACVASFSVQITGMGFSSVSGGVTVRFACPKGFVEAEGEVVSDTEVSFLTPNFEKFGPMQVSAVYTRYLAIVNRPELVLGCQRKVRVNGRVPPS